MSDFLNSKLGKYVFYTLLCVCFFTAFYLLMSFINTDFNFCNWNQQDRDKTAVFTGVSMLLKIFFDGVNRVANK